jgi:hypothetical protein
VKDQDPHGARLLVTDIQGHKTGRVWATIKHLVNPRSRALPSNLCLTTARPPRPALRAGRGREASAAHQWAAAVLERAERLGRGNRGADLRVVPCTLRFGRPLDLEKSTLTPIIYARGIYSDYNYCFS